MAQCTYCSAETQLFIDGAPICIACDDARSEGNKLTARKPPERETNGETISPVETLSNQTHVK